MEMPSSPPPLPTAKNKRVWIFVTAAVAFVIAALLAAGITGTVAFRKAQERRASARAAMDDLEKMAAEERTKMADSIQDGDVTGGGDALGRMKEQLEKSATQLGNNDAAATRAAANFLGKMQAQLRDYEASVARLTKEEVFSFNLRDKAMLGAHRQIVAEFLASNARVADTIRRGEELMGAELDAAKVPARLRKATLEGFTKSQTPIRKSQLQIRECDQTLGDAALAMFDLLEKNWGKWHLDEAGGAKRFDDPATLAAHDALIDKVQTAADEQAKAQEELVKRMREVKRQ